MCIYSILYSVATHDHIIRHIISIQSYLTFYFNIERLGWVGLTRWKGNTEEEWATWSGVVGLGQTEADLASSCSFPPLFYSRLTCPVQCWMTTPSSVFTSAKIWHGDDLDKTHGDALISCVPSDMTLILSHSCPRMLVKYHSNTSIRSCEHSNAKSNSLLPAVPEQTTFYDFALRPRHV